MEKKRMEKQVSFGSRVLMMEKKKKMISLEKHKSFGGRVSLDLDAYNNKKKKRGDSLVHVVARSGDVSRLKDILALHTGKAKEVLLSKGNVDGETPLYVASECGQSAVVAEMVVHMDLQSASIPARNGYDAFHIAARLSQVEVLQHLLSAFPNLAMTTDFSNMTPLHTAVAQGHSPVVRLLLQADSKLATIARNNGKTPLHTAARMAHLEILESLVANDPTSPFRTDAKGQTPLHMAAKCPDERILLELLQLSNHVLSSAQDNKGNTALHVALLKSRFHNVRALLLSPHAPSFINSLNKAFQTPLDIALAQPSPHPDLLSLLNQAGATSSSNHHPPPPKHQLTQTVSDIKHDVHSQLLHTRQTRFRVHKIARRLHKLHISGLNNAITSATVVAVLIATVAFAAIFTLPGQFVENPTLGYTVGQAHIATSAAFIVFFVFDSLALFISLAVVVVQTSVVVIEQTAKRQLVFVINKLMWLACLFISIAFIALTYIVVGSHSSWLAVYSTVLGATIMLTTVGSMCYCIVSHRIEESKLRNIRKLESRSRSFSASGVPSESEILNAEYNKRMYAL